VWFSGEEEI